MPMHKVYLFQRRMGLNCPDSYTPMTREVAQLRINLIMEEYTEVLEAFDLVHKDGTVETHMKLMKELCDLVFVAVGTAAEMGLNFLPFFNEVCRSNLTKIGGEIREDGKLIKPKDYTPANMMSVFEDE